MDVGRLHQSATVPVPGSVMAGGLRGGFGLAGPGDHCESVFLPRSFAFKPSVAITSSLGAPTAGFGVPAIWTVCSASAGGIFPRLAALPMPAGKEEHSH